MSGTLYLFPVELSEGTIEQVLPRHNIQIIRNVKHFIVENVRSARRFLKRCDKDINIDELTFFTLNQHTQAQEIDEFVKPLLDGADMGIISEAGCPAIADPGADIVAIAQRKDIRVVPLVGPSSILMAMMASGFNGQSFAFLGYLPIEQGERKSKLKTLEQRIRNEHQTQIFIETPYRNNRLIAELCKQLPGNLMLCVASDVSGESESILTRKLSVWAKATYDYDKIPTIFLLYK